MTDVTICLYFIYKGWALVTRGHAEFGASLTRWKPVGDMFTLVLLLVTCRYEGIEIFPLQLPTK